MPEAVIVATARSPIGRAFKGSLTGIRPDDLAAQMVTAALAKVPQLDPADIGDLILGCGTLARAALTIWAARSSGRMPVSEPLNARPIGDRAVATITASGMVPASSHRVHPDYVPG